MAAQIIAVLAGKEDEGYSKSSSLQVSTGTTVAATFMFRTTDLPSAAVAFWL